MAFNRLVMLFLEKSQELDPYSSQSYHSKPDCCFLPFLAHLKNLIGMRAGGRLVKQGLYLIPI